MIHANNPFALPEGTDVLCGAVLHPADDRVVPGHYLLVLDDAGYEPTCGDCAGLHTQVVALARPSDYLPEDTLRGYRSMAADLRGVIAHHVVTTPEAFSELARARYAEHSTGAPEDRGARTACERVMYPYRSDGQHLADPCTAPVTIGDQR